MNSHIGCYAYLPQQQKVHPDKSKSHLNFPQIKKSYWKMTIILLELLPDSSFQIPIYNFLLFCTIHSNLEFGLFIALCLANSHKCIFLHTKEQLHRKHDDKANYNQGTDNYISKNYLEFDLLYQSVNSRSFTTHNILLFHSY